jgi:hypothetical protein
VFDSIKLGSQYLHLTGTTRGAQHVGGLIGPPGARGEFFDRPEQDGAVAPFKGYMPSRIITIEGVTTAGGTVDSVWTDWQALAAQFEAALVGDVVLQWKHTNGSVTLQQNVRLADQSQPVFDASEQGAFIKYQVVLRAADPRWESTVSSATSTAAPSSSGGMPLPVVFPIPWGSGSVGGSVIVTNAGTTTSWPIITIQGPASGPVITCSAQNKFLSFDTLILGAADILSVDMHPSVRTATVNGANVLGSLRWLDSSFFGLRAGVAETIAFTALGGGTTAGSLMTVNKRDAYLG